MKLFKAIGLGALGWVLIFFEVSILMFGFKLTTGALYYIIHYILLAVFAIILSLIYFKGKKIKKGFFQGLLIGIIFIITGIILDSVITIPLFMKMDYSFLIDPYVLIGELLIIVICGLVGLGKR